MIIFDETLTNEERIDAIMSSTAIPFIFTPVLMDDKVLVDGGIFSTVSMGDPIARCREEEGPDVDIIVDLILCYETIEHHMPELKLEDTRWMNAHSMYDRRKKITDYYFWKEDIVRMERSSSYDDIQFRLVVMPS